MSCEEYQGRRLAGEESPILDAHVAGCAACRAGLASLDRLRAALSEPSVWESPGPNLEGHILAEFERRRAPAGGRRSRLAWVAGAAVAAVALVVSFVWSGAPDWEVYLVATPNAPLAMATVEGWNEPEGTRMRFEIEELEPAPEGTYYEIWLTAADGRHVSGGTFTGPGVFETSIGVGRRDFPRVWITLEPADDDLGPSRTVVFDNPGY